MDALRTDVRIEFAKSAKRSLAVSAAASIVVFAVSAILSGDGVVVSKSDGDGMVSSWLGDRIGDSPARVLGASKGDDPADLLTPLRLHVFHNKKYPPR